MATEKETFAQARPINPSCLGIYSWVNCSGNVDVSNLKPSISLLPTTSTATASASPVYQPHPPSLSGCNTSKRFAFATNEELSLKKGYQQIQRIGLSSQEFSAPDDQQEHLSPKWSNTKWYLSMYRYSNLHLSRFVVEIEWRAVSSSQLLLYQLLHVCGILRYTRSKNQILRQEG